MRGLFGKTWMIVAVLGLAIPGSALAEQSDVGPVSGVQKENGVLLAENGRAGRILGGFRNLSNDAKTAPSSGSSPSVNDPGASSPGKPKHPWVVGPGTIGPIKDPGTPDPGKPDPGKPGGDKPPGHDQPQGGDKHHWPHWTQWPYYGGRGNVHAIQGTPYTTYRLPTPALPANAALVQIINPAENRATIGFMLDGQVVRLEAGQAGDFPVATSGLVKFHRGGSFGVASYTLKEGAYRFAATPQGWDLYLETAQPQQPSELPNNPVPGQ